MRETASGPAVLLGCPHPTLSGLCIPISKQVRWSSRSGFWTHCERIELSTGGDITPVFGRDFGAFPRETGLHRYHALSIWASSHQELNNLEKHRKFSIDGGFPS